MTEPALPIALRAGPPAEPAALERLYARAFPDEALWPLAEALLAEAPPSEASGVLSLSAYAQDATGKDAGPGRAGPGDALAGHVFFTLCAIEGRVERAALLGPLAVDPARQRRGVGSALVREGLRRAVSLGARQAHVLGDPAYYARFGFEPDGGAIPPCPIPAAWASAWRSLSLVDRAPTISGALRPPPPWRDPRYWAP